MLKHISAEDVDARDIGDIRINDEHHSLHGYIAFENFYEIVIRSIKADIITLRRGWVGMSERIVNAIVEDYNKRVDEENAKS